MQHSISQSRWLKSVLEQQQAMLLINGEGFRGGRETALSKTRGMILPGPEATEWFSMGLSWGFGGITVLLWLQKTNLLLLLIPVLPSSSENMILRRNVSASSTSLLCRIPSVQSAVWKGWSFSTSWAAVSPDLDVSHRVWLWKVWQWLLKDQPCACKQPRGCFYTCLTVSFMKLQTLVSYKYF